MYRFRIDICATLRSIKPILNSLAGGNAYPNTFSLVKTGTRLPGVPCGHGSGVINGTIFGNQFTFHSLYAGINCSSDAVATTDGRTMTGTFLDSQGTSGTFTLRNTGPILTPNVTISDPPVVQVSHDIAKITLVRFSRAEKRS